MMVILYVGYIMVTGDTTAIVFGLQPNIEYTASVTAVGSSCTSDPAVKISWYKPVIA